MPGSYKGYSRGIFSPTGEFHIVQECQIDHGRGSRDRLSSRHDDLPITRTTYADGTRSSGLDCAINPNRDCPRKIMFRTAIFTGQRTTTKGSHGVLGLLRVVALNIFQTRRVFTTTTPCEPCIFLRQHHLCHSEKNSGDLKNRWPAYFTTVSSSLHSLSGSTCPPHSLPPSPAHP
jgi:hypothetical protein